ncbi:MAG: MAPEG family protein [Maricaulaceae bacterium]
MTLFQIVALYTAIHLIILPILMFRVGQVRLSEKISLGDDGNAALLARVRAHGNYIETTPMALIGLMAMAWMSVAPLVLHIFGSAFLIGRLAHAHGMAQKDAIGKGRTLGAVLTLLTFLGTGITLLYTLFYAIFVGG